MTETSPAAYIRRIVDRAVYLRCDYASRLIMMMDLELASRVFQLRLHDLLNAPIPDFMHDVSGIGAHLNRVTKKFDPTFVPRYAGKEN